MTKDLALLVGGDQEFQTTQEFLASIDENLQKEMTSSAEQNRPSRSPSPAPPGRSATRCCSGSPPGRCSAPTRPVELRLLEIPDALQGRRGDRDGARRLRLPAARAGSRSPTTPRSPSTAPTSRLLVGARPRGPGMERADLLEANGGIFKPQGEAINAGAADDVKVLVVGNPANTNCLIAMSNAPDVPRERFTAMMRLDHNRAIAQLAKKLGRRGQRGHRMTIWGNHSTTQYPDLVHAQVGDRSAWDAVDDEALDRRRVHPDGRQARRGDHRGARRLERRLGRQRGDRPRPRLGRSARRRATGSRWRSPSDGSYGVDEGLICRRSVHVRGRRVVDRRGPRDRRLLARADRRLGRRARGRARGGHGARARSERPALDRGPIRSRVVRAARPCLTLPSFSRSPSTRYR